MAKNTEEISCVSHEYYMAVPRNKFGGHGATLLREEK